MRDANYNETIAFLSAFFRDTSEAVELRALPNGAGSPKVEFTRNPLRVIAFCQHYDGLGWGVYFGIATRDESGRGGGREFLRELPALWTEIDIHKFGVTVEEACAVLLSCPLPPSLIVSSGRGLHVYWMLASPFSVTFAPFGEDAEKTRVELATRSLARIFHGDTNACDLTRILRLPGTHNTREGTLLPCRVLEASWARYELEQVEAFAALSPVLMIGVPTAAPVPDHPPGEPPDPDDPFASYAQAMAMDIEAELAAMALHDEEKPLHWTRMRAAASLVARGHSDEVIFSRLMAETARVVAAGGEFWTPSRVRFEEKRLRDEIRGAHAKGYAPKKAVEPELPSGVVRLMPKQQERPDDDPLPPRGAGRGRPTIPVRAGHLSELADQAERLLLDYSAPVYRRTSKLMRPVIEEDDAADGLKTKVARLVEVSQAFMVDYLGRLAHWVKYEKRAKAWVACDPPKNVAETVLAREGEWLAPSVAGVITTPTLRPDGSILTIEGYDAATRLILLSPPSLPIIPPQPSREDALAALALLEGLLTEFCFIDEPSYSVALSALITPVVRGAFPVVPAHVMRAPVAGSGKSYLVDIAAVISTGQRCPVISSGKDEVEQEKRIGAVLIGGQSIVSIDNLNGELRGDALCQMVERPVVQIRILGRSELMRVETRATLFATGNNIVVVGDMVRRTLLASMDAELERPELREFKQSPLDMVLADRGKYIAACLIIVRAYLGAGSPGVLPPLASYEKWSAFVRSALVWLGRADPVDSMETTRSEDPELSALRDVVNCWSATGSSATMRTSRELIALSATRDILTEDNNGHMTVIDRGPLYPEFAEALEVVAAGKVGVDARALGKYLIRQKNRVIDGMKIAGADDGKAKIKKWWLTKPVK